MAKINAYVSANYANQKLDAGGQFGPGICQFTSIAVFVVGSTDVAGSIYRLFKGIPADAIITELKIRNDALTGATSVNLGLYDVLDFDGVGAIIGTGDQFMTATDISAGTAISATERDGLTNLSIANRIVQLWKVAGEALYPPKRASFDICMTMTAMTTGATGNVSAKLGYIRAV